MRFLSADYFVREMQPLGMTMRGFRGLCKALGVPMLRIGRTWVVELFSFHTAMRAIMRIGQPDFLAPGCDYKASGGEKKGMTTTLSREYYEENFEALIGEMLAARAVHGLPSPRATVRAAKQAAKRLVNFGIQEIPLAASRRSSKDFYANGMRDRAPGKMPKI